MTFRLSCRAAEKLKPVSLMRLTQIDDVDELLKKFARNDIVVEEKLDGWKTQIIKSEGKIRIYSRKGDEKTENFPELVKALSFLPDSTMVEGELVYWEKGKQDVGKVTSLAGSSAENSQEKAKELSGEIKIHLYDILWHKGKNVAQEPFEKRRKLLQSVVKTSTKIQLTKQYPFNDWQKAMNTAVKSGGEGIVLKIKDKAYQYKPAGQAEPKPNEVMYKYKGGIGKSDSDDYVVYDYEVSEKGKLKALFGQYYKGKLYHISEISNFSKEDEEKVKSKLKKGQFIIEIGFQERQPGGLRHQKFMRFRDDKKPKDATMNEFHVEHIDNFEVAKKSEANDEEEFPCGQMYEEHQIYEDDSGNEYNINALFDLTVNNPVQEVPLNKLEHLLSKDAWGYSPKDVLDNPKKYPDEFNMIKSADLNYPIFLYKDDVVDGNHRLAKAFLEKKPAIKVKYMTDKQMAQAKIKKADDDDEKAHHAKLISEFKKILDEVGADYNSVVIGGSAVLGGLGLKKINDLDVNVGPEDFEKLKKHPDAVVDEKRPGTWRIRFDTSAGEIEVFSGSWMFGDEDYMSEGTPTVELQGLKHWAPKHTLKWKKFMNRPKDQSDIELLEKQSSDFRLSKRADFADEVIQDLEAKTGKKPSKPGYASKVQDFSGLRDLGDPIVDVQKAYQMMSMHESNQFYIIGDAGTSFGSTQVQFGSFVNQLSRDPQAKALTGLDPSQLQELNTAWNEAKKIVGNRNIWKIVSVDSEKVKEFMKSHPNDVIRRKEGTTIRMNPGSFPGVVKIVDGKFVGYEIDADMLKSLGVDANKNLADLQNTTKQYATDAVVRNAIVRLVMANLKPELYNKFYSTFSRQNVNKNQQLRNLADRATQRDFMNRIEQVVNATKKYGYDTRAPGAFNIYQLIVIANASGVGRVIQFLKDRKPFSAGNLNLGRSNKMISQIIGIPSEIPPNGGMAGFGKAIADMHFSISKRADESDQSEFEEEEITQVNIDPRMFATMSLYINWLNNFLDNAQFSAVLSKKVMERKGLKRAPDKDDVIRLLRKEIENYVKTNWYKIAIEPENINFFKEYLDQEWKIDLRLKAPNESAPATEKIKTQPKGFKEEITKVQLHPALLAAQSLFMSWFKEFMGTPEFSSTLAKKYMQMYKTKNPPIYEQIKQSFENNLLKYIKENAKEIIQNPKDPKFFIDYVDKYWDMVLNIKHEAAQNFVISKRAEYTEPGVLYFPGSYANDIKDGKRKMTIRAADVPVEVSEVVKCKSYSGAHICDLYITSKERMSLSRIEKAFGERIAKALEQKFGADRRFVVVRFDVYENVNAADDEEIPEIDFPEEEWEALEKRLKKDKGIYTTRISKERNKYKEDQEYMTPWGHKVKVVSIITLDGVENHPFIDELTDEQKEQIGKKKYDLIRLEKIVDENADDEDDKKWEEVLIDKDGVKLTRQQIKNHYMKAETRKKIMSRIKGNPVLIYIGTGTNEKILKRNHNNKPIVITNDDPEKKESPNNYFYWVERRLLAIHQVFGPKTNLGFVDLDIHGSFSLADAKKYAKEVSAKVKDKFGISSTIYQSGGTGLHVEFELKEETNINTLRAELKDMLDELNEDWENVTTSVVKGKGMRSDVSTLHNKGSIRVPGSLGETYGKVKKPLGSDQDGDDDTFGNTNFGTKYTNRPENLDEDPGSLDTGAIVVKPDMGAFPEADTDCYVFALSKREKLIKQSIYRNPKLKKEYIWFWDPEKKEFFFRLIYEKGKELPVYSHYELAELVDSSVIFTEKVYRGYVYFFEGQEEGEIHLYSGEPDRMPIELRKALRQLTKGGQETKKIETLPGASGELWKIKEKERQLSEHMEKRKWMGHDDPDPEFVKLLNLKFASGSNNPKDWERAKEQLQTIWKLAGLMEEDEEEFERMMEKQQERGGEEEEDEASKWLAEHDPERPREEERPRKQKEKQPRKQKEEKPKIEVPGVSLYEQLEGEIPKQLQSKKPKKIKKKKEPKVEEPKKEEPKAKEEITTEKAQKAYEDMLNALQGLGPEEGVVPPSEELEIEKPKIKEPKVEIPKEEPKKEEPKKEESKTSLKEQTALISSIISSKAFEKIKAKVDKQVNEDARLFQEYAAGLSHEELLKYLMEESEFEDADKTLRKEYADKLIEQFKELSDFPKDLVTKEIQKKLNSPAEKAKELHEDETGRTADDVGEEFAIDDLLRMSEEDKKQAKPSFADKLVAPTDEKGHIAQSWPKIQIPPLSEDLVEYFHPDNLSDGQSLRKTFANPKVWEALKANPWLLQKWVLPSIIISIGYRWFELNSSKENVARRADRKKGNVISFDHLQGGAPFSMLDDIISEENIKKLQDGEITVSDLPEAKEYIQHINRIITEITNAYFSKEDLRIPIDKYIYDGLQHEMVRIVAEKNGYKRKIVPKCSICLLEADQRTEIEAMVHVGKGIFKCKNCERIGESLKTRLPDVKDELQRINKKLTSYVDAKNRLSNEELADFVRQRLADVIKNTEPSVPSLETRKSVLEEEIKEISRKFVLRSAQSRVPYFHTLCPNPTCKLQNVPLTAVDWEDPVWDTAEGEELRKKLKERYQIEMPVMEQNAEEFKLDKPIPKYIKKSLIPKEKQSWVYFVPFKCPYDNIRFKMKDVFGQGYKGLAGFFYYPHTKVVWKPVDEESKKAVEKDPQKDPTNEAPVLSALKSVGERASKAASLQYYEFYAYLRALDVALKAGKKTFEVNGKTYDAKPLTKKQKAGYARELLLYSAITDLVSSDLDAYLYWLAGSELLGKPVYENGEVQNKNTATRILSYSDKRDQIYLPILQKWIDRMITMEKLPEWVDLTDPSLGEKTKQIPRPDFVKKFDLEDWLVKVGRIQEDGSYTDDGIPSDGPGTYFIAQVKKSIESDDNFYGFSCQLESKRRKDDKYKKTFDKRGPRLLRVLDVYKVGAQDIKMLTSAQKDGKDAIPKITAENILKKAKENLAPEIKNHNFHEVYLDDMKTSLVPNDFVLVRAFVMPGKFYFGPLISIQDVEKNKRDFEFWQKFYELVRLEQNNPEYWREFEERFSIAKPYLHSLDDMLDRELFMAKAKTKKKAEFQLSVRSAEDIEGPVRPYEKYDPKGALEVLKDLALETGIPEGWNAMRLLNSTIFKSEDVFPTILESFYMWFLLHAPEKSEIAKKLIFEAGLGIKELERVEKYIEKIKKANFQLSIRVAKDPLSTYKKKRDFEETKEPEGTEEKGANKHRFVIQKHDAKKARTHFDLRLENDDGAMSSWAVPKHKMPGEKDKLLAMKTEDHPISYNKFEGEIPEGEYGAGKVEIYDSGTYEEIEWSASKIVFKLKGKKEKGTYNLVKTDGSRWLWMKAKEQDAKDNSRVLYHIGKRPPRPVPLDEIYRERIDVETGFFMTDKPLEVGIQHNILGNVYAYEIPEWVIDEAGGLRKYDRAKEIVIPQELWEKAKKEIRFLGKVMEEKEFVKDVEAHGKTRYKLHQEYTKPKPPAPENVIKLLKNNYQFAWVWERLDEKEIIKIKDMVEKELAKNDSLSKLERNNLEQAMRTFKRVLELHSEQDIDK